MSWSFRYMGKVEAVRRDVEKFDAHLDVAEHDAMVASKAAILKHLEICSPSTGVDVWAAGSFYKTTDKSNVSNEVKINTVLLSE